MIRSVLLMMLVFVPMIAEARRSRRHERALRSAGAVEPRGDVYRAMQIAYPAAFCGMIAEGWRQQVGSTRTCAGLMVFGTGKALKYWAIWTLGPRWTFRVLVPPDAPRITTGPYRWLRHPNYAGVLGELAGVALLSNAPRAGLVSIVVFGGLMLARIAVEERALEGRDSAI